MGTEKEMSNTFADICKTRNQLIEEEKILERKEILDYLEDTELFSRSDLRNADNMLNNNQSVPINELAERFIKIDKEFSGRPWNILQILSQINMIVPVEDRKCVETGAEEFQKKLIEEETMDKKEILESLENCKTSGMKEVVDNWFEKKERGFKMMEIRGATLLSEKEAKTLLTEKERRYKGWWWLRSSDYGQPYAAVIYYDGSVILYSSYALDHTGCVRPALKVNIDNSDFKIRDTFVFGKKTFKIISNELAFCMEDIGMCHFREDWIDSDANDIVSDATDYEKSDVKKFVDAWFAKAMRERKSQEQKPEVKEEKHDAFC